jgi:hypothetical protein
MRASDMTPERRAKFTEVMTVMDGAEKNLTVTMSDYIDMWQLPADAVVNGVPRASLITYQRERLHALLDIHLDSCDAAFTLLHQYGMLPQMHKKI